MKPWALWGSSCYADLEFGPCELLLEAGRLVPLPNRQGRGRMAWPTWLLLGLGLAVAEEITQATAPWPGADVQVKLVSGECRGREEESGVCEQMPSCKPLCERQDCLFRAWSAPWRERQGDQVVGVYLSGSVKS